MRSGLPDQFAEYQSFWPPGQLQLALAAINFENMTAPSTSLLESLKHLNAQQLRRLLVEHLTQQKVGLYPT